MYLSIQVQRCQMVDMHSLTQQFQSLQHYVIWQDELSQKRNSGHI